MGEHAKFKTVSMKMSNVTMSSSPSIEALLAQASTVDKPTRKRLLAHHNGESQLFDCARQHVCATVSG